MNKSSLLHQLSTLRDRVAVLGEQFGYTRSLVLTRRYLPEGTKELITQHREVTPQPIISMGPMALGSSYNVQVRLDDFVVQGISKANFTREWVEGSGISYTIDGKLLGTKLIGGFNCDFVTLRDNPLTWDLVLRRKVDERNAYSDNSVSAPKNFR